MSFKTLSENTDENKALLQKVATEFGVEVRANAKAETIIAALEEDGISWEMAVQHVNELAPIDAAYQEAAADRRANGPKELVKMERLNRSYEVRGVVFTKEHPYALVAEEDAEWITENEEGFRYASPKEAKEFYS